MPDEPTPALLAIDVVSEPEAVLSLTGDLDPHTAPDLEAAVAELAAVDGVVRVTIDLAGVTFLDSSGLRAFVVARELLGERGVPLALANPTPNVRRLIEVTGLGEVITIR